MMDNTAEVELLSCKKKYQSPSHRKEYRRAYRLKFYQDVNNQEKKKLLDSKRYFRLKKEKPWKIVYHNIIKRVNNDPGYKGYIFALAEEDVKCVWFRDKAWLLKRPSIDRIDNKEGYIKTNIQFIELSINSVKDKTRKRRI